MLETRRMEISEAKECDIHQIIEIESRPDTRDFLWIGKYEEHLQEISDPNHRLLVFRYKNKSEIMGYALIRLKDMVKSQWRHYSNMPLKV